MSAARIIIIIGILGFLTFMVFGILYGWFRAPGKLTDEQINELNKVKPVIAQDCQSMNRDDLFEKLWYDHVRLTRNFILAYLHNSDDADQIEKSLMKNQEDIGNALEGFYAGSAAVITPILKEHIAQAKDIVTDLKQRRLSRLSSDINKWYKNADAFSEAMNMINPKFNLYRHMYEHLRITEREALYEWINATGLSKNIYEERIVPNAQSLAKQISTNL